MSLELLRDRYRERGKKLTWNRQGDSRDQAGGRTTEEGRAKMRVVSVRRLEKK